MAQRRVPDDIQRAFRRAPGHVLSNRALVDLGVKSWKLSELVAAGALDRMLPSQYRLAGDDTPFQTAHLAVSYLRTARPTAPALVSGAEGLAAAGHELIRPSTPLVLVDHGRRIALPDPPFAISQRSALDQVPVSRRQGLPTPPLPVMLADLVLELAPDDDRLAAWLYRVLNRTAVTPLELVQTWTDMPRHPGARRLLALTAQGVLEHESPAERSFYSDVFGAHPPAPDCQVWVAPNIRVDFIYVFAGLVIEYFGEEAHGDAVDRDGTRILAMRNLGLDVLVVTKTPARERDGLAGQIHRLRREREALMLRGMLRRPALPAQPDRLTPLRTLVPLG